MRRRWQQFIEEGTKQEFKRSVLRALGERHCGRCFRPVDEEIYYYYAGCRTTARLRCDVCTKDMFMLSMSPEARRLIAQVLDSHRASSRSR